MPVDTGRNAWVIETCITTHFEVVSQAVLFQRGKYWFDTRLINHKEEDIFDTELDARNALEQRLYARLLELQKHREAMTKLLLACVPPMPKAKEPPSYPEQDYFSDMRPLEVDW